MTTATHDDRRARIEGAGATLLIHAAIGFALLWGLDAPLPAEILRRFAGR